MDWLKRLPGIGPLVTRLTATHTWRAYERLDRVKWTRLAAEQGYAPAQTDLAYLYEQGKGVPLDYVNAYVWYRAASAAGDKRAEAKLKELKRRMTPRQISIATNYAEEMQQRAWRPEVNDVWPKN